uniref:Taste receptor type 2 n=1 Tax=Balaenoptera musculus TaxID=9771 RepID=A0A8C0DM90_BALMU
FLPRAFIFAIILFLLCLVAVVGNGLITVALGMEWLLQRTLSPCNKLLVSLGASSFSFPYNPVFQFLAFQWDFLNAVTLWFSTWLSVFYCVKIIANFTHPTFLWLKYRFPGLVPWLLLGSLLISLIITLLFFWGNHDLYKGFLIRKFSGNLTYNQRSRRLEILHFLPLKLVTLSIPCSLFLVSMAVLMNSLRRHMWRMRHSAHSLQEPSAQAHTRAPKSLISFLVLYALSFMSLIIDAAGFYSSESDWYWPWQILTYSCTSIHPFILILSHLRLRGVFRQLILLARGFWVA